MVESHFTTLDWLILGAYFVLILITGKLFARKQSSTKDYFLAGGGIPAWAAAISLLASALSAATFIGGPQQAYKGDLTYLSANIGSILAVVVVAYFFVPVLFHKRVMTVYGLLEERFGTPARMAAGGAFLIGRVFASGARLYIAALPTSLLIFGDVATGHLLVAISVMTLIGIGYTLVGGVRSVIWTDVIQTFIFTGAALAALIVLLSKIPLPVSGIIDALQHPGEGLASKLTILKLGFDGFDPKQSYTLLTALFGFTLLNIGAYGTDQDLTQRMLTCKNSIEGGKSAIGGILIGLPVTALFMIVGLLLFIFYQRPDLMGALTPAYQPEGSRQIFLTFILNEMPSGMSGLMMAGLLATAIATTVSALNAMSSTFVSDFYMKLRPLRSETEYVKMGMWGVAGSGIALGLFAIGSVFWQAARPGTTLIDFALSVMVFAYSGLVAVYLTTLFTKRGSTVSVIAGLLTGFTAVIVMQSFFGAQIAFPWQMSIATLLAFAVCQIGKPINIAVPQENG